MGIRKNFSQNHLFALLTVWKLINATSDAVAKSQNMPKLRDYWKAYLKDLEGYGYAVSRVVHYTSANGKATQKLGTFYALTASGAEVVADALQVPPETVFFPTGGIQSKSPFQFPHRAKLTELFGSFLGHEKKSGGTFEILDLVPEYRYTGANRQGTGHKATKAVLADGNNIIPDGIIRFRAGETVRVATIEFHRTTSPQMIIEQLRKHALAIDQRLFPNMFGHKYQNHVLSVYDDVNKLLNVKKRIESGEFPNFSRDSAGFHFATLDDIFNMGIENAFYKLSGEKTAIF
jgi:hypothetical protein